MATKLIKLVCLVRMMLLAKLFYFMGCCCKIGFSRCTESFDQTGFFYHHKASFLASLLLAAAASYCRIIAVLHFLAYKVNPKINIGLKCRHIGKY